MRYGTPSGSGAALLLLGGSLFLSSTGRAHEGTESSQGCHNDYRTGQYHCHTPKNPQAESASIDYCHVMRGLINCGHTREACAQIAIQHGGSCQPQMSFRTE